jgi:hypothetical protein
MSTPACRRSASLLVAAAIGWWAAPSPGAVAGDVVEQARAAESLAARGYGAAALAAFDRATAAFWADLPLQLRVIAFADSVSDYGDFVPRPTPEFAEGDTLRVYFEPVGYAILPDAGGFRSGLAVDIEIRSPGGLIFASTRDYARLEWKGRNPMHEVHATVAIALPANLRPGHYLLVLTLRDEGSVKTSEANLSFAIVD